jgi:hypothetical protein
MARLFADTTHGLNMAISMKNSGELLNRIPDMQFDFVTVEECNEFDECQTFIDAFGKSKVFLIEYTKQAYFKGCQKYPKVALVLRDRMLVGKENPMYVFALCNSIFLKLGLTFYLILIYLFLI